MMDGWGTDEWVALAVIVYFAKTIYEFVLQHRNGNGKEIAVLQTQIEHLRQAQAALDERLQRYEKNFRP